jgi:hypothetical protein
MRRKTTGCIRSLHLQRIRVANRFDRAVIGDSYFAGMLLGIDEPGFSDALAILCQPGAPLFAILNLEGFHATVRQAIT